MVNKWSINILSCWNYQGKKSGNFFTKLSGHPCPITLYSTVPFVTCLDHPRRGNSILNCMKYLFRIDSLVWRCVHTNICRYHSNPPPLTPPYLCKLPPCIHPTPVYSPYPRIFTLIYPRLFITGADPGIPEKGGGGGPQKGGSIGIFKLTRKSKITLKVRG